MELKISENMYEDDFDDYANEFIKSSFEQIPENTVPIKVIKKGVHFDDSVSQKPTHQSIPRVNAKIVRPQMPPQKPKISYEDILSKMGMLVSDGKLHLVDRNTLTPQKQQEILSSQRQSLTPQYQQTQYKEEQINTNVSPNSYIYNKYFKDDIQEQNTVRKPRTLQEYKRMLLEDYIERERIKQMKSTKLIMPTSNINIAGSSANLNKLFGFSKR